MALARSKSRSGLDRQVSIVVASSAPPGRPGEPDGCGAGQGGPTPSEYYFPVLRRAPRDEVALDKVAVKLSGVERIDAES